MEKTDLDKILQYFTKYSDRDYCECLSESKKASRYNHNWEEFPIIVFADTNEVYQLNTEAEVMGIELINYDKFIERFESFTGCKIDDFKSEDEYIERDIEL